MKRFWKIMTIYLAFGFLFSGCGSSQREAPKELNLVTGIEVSYDHQQIHLQRSYTSTDKMDTVLFYLYTLSPYGRVQVDPECITDESCKITVIMTDGQTRTYRQRGQEYLSVDCRPWQKIDPKKAEKLFPILLGMSSDL